MIILAVPLELKFSAADMWLLFYKDYLLVKVFSSHCLTIKEQLI